MAHTGRGSILIAAQRQICTAESGLFLAVLLEQKAIHDLPYGITVKLIQLMQCLKETAILGRKRSLGLHAQQFGHGNIQLFAESGNIIYVRTGQSQFPVADRRLGVSESGSKLCLIHSGFGTVLADDLTDMRTSFCIDDRAATSTSCFLL